MIDSRAEGELVSLGIADAGAASGRRAALADFTFHGQSEFGGGVGWDGDFRKEFPVFDFPGTGEFWKWRRWWTPARRAFT